MSNKFIIDTNVLIIGNRKNDNLSESDIQACEKFIQSLLNDSIIFLDSEYLIFAEYFRYLNNSGQPGLGDAFLKKIFDNQYNKDICQIVDIHYSTTDKTNFLEFPDDYSLSKFDISDRKFVAVAVSANKVPIIANGSDSDWYNYKCSFEKLNIKIDFICKDEYNKWNKNNI